MSLLEIEDLAVDYTGREDPVRILDGIDLAVDRGDVLGIVGESGAGKSILLRTILGLLPPRCLPVRGAIRYDGANLLTLAEPDLEKIRGRAIGLTLSNARQNLNPVMPIGRQIRAVIAKHQEVSRDASIARTVDLLRSVGIPDPEARYYAYPHELSGGMCQRVIIAMALANAPDVILADEPTSGLDVTISIQILDLMRKAVAESGSALVLVSRDLGVIANYAKRVGVMLSGQMIEIAPVEEFFDRAVHPYSRHLIRAAAASRDASLAASRRIAAAATGWSGAGCRFRRRCRAALQACAEGPLPVEPVAPDHLVRCVRSREFFSGELRP